jgi:hypothetical protein
MPMTFGVASTMMVPTPRGTVHRRTEVVRPAYLGVAGSDADVFVHGHPGVGAFN